VAPTAFGSDLKTALGGWFVLGDGDVPAWTVTAVEQRALWVAVVTVKAAVKEPAVA